jgi:hypothetical protein
VPEHFNSARTHSTAAFQETVVPVCSAMFAVHPKFIFSKQEYEKYQGDTEQP